jgi:RNA-directed DNA polymerase
MKRTGNLFDNIVSLENLRAAHHRARRGKAHYREVREVNANEEALLQALHERLTSGAFTTSAYRVEERFDGRKLRTIHKLPYYPDRIVQHALCAVCAPAWERSLIRDTFQSLPGRGTSDARERLTRAVRQDKPRYALKLDVSKYYPSVNNERMKAVVRRTVKCPRTLALIDDIIDSAQGLPIGNYTSQIFGNLYLAELDWWAKQQRGLRHYFRYCDDIVILHDDKAELAQIKRQITEQLGGIGLHVKPNWQIVDVHAQGVDFCGYVFRPERTLLRRRIKDNFRRKAREILTEYRRRSPTLIINGLMAYWGWIKPIDARPLWHSVVTEPLLRLADRLPVRTNPLRSVT